MSTEPVAIDFAGVRLRARLPPASAASVAKLPLCRVSSGESPGGSTPRIQIETTLDLQMQSQSVGPRFEPGVGKDISFAWDGERANLRAPGMRGELTRVQPARFSLRARIAPDREAMASLVQATAVAAYSVMGGVLLHAAAVEWQGRVVAFVGPSGAGKSTACTQLEGARMFSWDRLLVVPDEAPVGQSAGAFRALAFPGGSAPPKPLPPSEHTDLPLAALLAVQRGETCQILPMSPLAAVALLRRVALTGGAAAAEQVRLLGHLEALAGSVPLARLRFPLAQPLADALRGFVLHSPSP